jgi:hypothetical protein
MTNQAIQQIRAGRIVPVVVIEDAVVAVDLAEWAGSYGAAWNAMQKNDLN